MTYIISNGVENVSEIECIHCVPMRVKAIVEAPARIIIVDYAHWPISFHRFSFPIYYVLYHCCYSFSQHETDPLPILTGSLHKTGASSARASHCRAAEGSRNVLREYVCVCAYLYLYIYNYDMCARVYYYILHYFILNAAFIVSTACAHNGNPVECDFLLVFLEVSNI